MKDPFPTTVWSDLQHRTDEGDAGARRALTNLYEAYWSPLYAYLRRRGLPVEEAQDVLQSFYLSLFQRNVVNRLDRKNSHLRAFLLTALKNHLGDHRDREMARIRRPEVPLFPLDVLIEEGRYKNLVAEDGTPEDAFNLRWAHALAARAANGLSERERVAGNESAFKRLEAHVFGGADVAPLSEVAGALGISVGAVKVRIHRYRKRLGALLRDEIKRTVHESADTDEELRLLVSYLEVGGGMPSPG